MSWNLSFVFCTLLTLNRNLVIDITMSEDLVIQVCVLMKYNSYCVKTYAWYGGIGLQSNLVTLLYTMTSVYFINRLWSNALMEIPGMNFLNVMRIFCQPFMLEQVKLSRVAFLWSSQKCNGWHLTITWSLERWTLILFNDNITLKTDAVLL